MTRKVFDGENNTEVIMDESMSEVEPAVKQMIRNLSSASGEQYDSVYAVDAELTSWLKKGYKLLTAQYIASDQQSFSIFYVLVRQ